jgi:hypothetical protein
MSSVVDNTPYVHLSSLVSRLANTMNLIVAKTSLKFQLSPSTTGGSLFIFVVLSRPSLTKSFATSETLARLWSRTTFRKCSSDMCILAIYSSMSSISSSVGIDCEVMHVR